MGNATADIMPMGVCILMPTILVLIGAARLTIKFSPDFADTQAAEQLSTLFENNQAERTAIESKLLKTIKKGHKQC